MKNTLLSLKGADEKFLQAVRNLTNNSVSVDCRYVPVYRVIATGTYYWSNTSTETHYGTNASVDVTTKNNYENTRTFSNFYYKSVYDSCCPNLFIGGENTRFYTLDIPSNLPYNIYNTNNYLSQKEAYSLADKMVKKGNNVGDSYTFDGWSCEAYFVPFVCLSFTFDGVVYTTVVNMHNGRLNYQYKSSEKTNKMAEVQYQKSRKYKLWSIICSAIMLLYCLIAFFLMKKNIGWDLLLFVLSISYITVNIIYNLIGTRYHNLDYFKNRFAISQEKGENANETELSFLIGAICGLVGIVIHLIICL